MIYHNTTICLTFFNEEGKTSQTVEIAQEDIETVELVPEAMIGKAYIIAIPFNTTKH